jgi:transcriptional regulator with XRE-family HTH domain
MNNKILPGKKSRIAEILNRVSSLTKRKVEKKMEIAAQIKTLLDEHYWTQSNLADKLKKNESEISKWLAGEHNFTIDTICTIEEVLNADIIQIPMFNVNKKYNFMVLNFSFTNYKETRGMAIINPNNNLDMSGHYLRPNTVSESMEEYLTKIQ